MKKILLVEDEEPVRRLLERFLRNQNFAVKSFPHAEAALKHLEEGSRYDALLTDVDMPGISGLEFLQVAKVNGYIDRTTVVIMSGDPRQEILQACDKYNAPFLKKPFALTHVLLHTLTEALK